MCTSSSHRSDWYVWQEERRHAQLSEVFQRDVRRARCSLTGYSEPVIPLTSSHQEVRRAGRHRADRGRAGPCRCCGAAR
ncbi:hypothetical protein EYF80_051257 [Liparis tanakae]|uniref:Uncharacterized protein n=1 Tax=Liparis tanakae TaxID=230148 RepID=A0A4Z2FCV4_9TELE|nr:hypothetical protein EYF80_051257 [Liparis tanakae]